MVFEVKTQRVVPRELGFLVGPPLIMFSALLSNLKSVLAYIFVIRKVKAAIKQTIDAFNVGIETVENIVILSEWNQLTLLNPVDRAPAELASELLPSDND